MTVMRGKLQSHEALQMTHQIKMTEKYWLKEVFYIEKKMKC